jgi:hypothetical protein
VIKIHFDGIVQRSLRDLVKNYKKMMNEISLSRFLQSCHHFVQEFFEIEWVLFKGFWAILAPQNKKKEFENCWPCRTGSLLFFDFIEESFLLF